MLDLRNNFRRKYEHLKCPCCSLGIDKAEHLFTKCVNIKDIQAKYNINDYYQVFEARITTERLREIINFIRDIGVEKLEY